MTREIERKWLVPEWPANIPLLHEWDVEQSYLYVGEDIEVRLHRKVDKSGKTETYQCLTIKIGQGIERIELPLMISKETYDIFLQEVKGTPLTKKFRVYDVDGMHLDIGMVDDKFIYAEIEFNSREEADAYVLPFDWQEVTNDSFYNMKNYWIRTHSI